MRLSGEMQFVITASKSKPSNEELVELQGIAASGLDWQLVVVLARRHKVFPRVWQLVGGQFSQHVPAEIYEIQKQLFKNYFLSSALKAKYLLELLEIFARNDVAVIPYKGPVLAIYLYGDVAQRSYGDLDLLIAPGDFGKVLTILQRNGYTPEVDVPVNAADAYCHTEDNLSFQGRNGLCVELHWELSGRYLQKSFGIDTVGRKLETISLFGRKVDVFSAENLLIYSALHGTKHCWEQLDLVACVAEVLRKEKELDWQYIHDTVCEYRCRRMLAVALLLACKLYSCNLPQVWKRELLEDSAAIDLSERIYHLVYVNESGGMGNKGKTDPRFSLFRLRVRDSWLDAGRYMIRLLFVPSKSEWSAVSVPAYLSWIYYLMRPFRVAWAAVWGGIRRKWYN